MEEPIIYQTKVKVTKESMKDISFLNDEFFERGMAAQIIKDIKIEHLRKIFKFTKTDFVLSESKERLRGENQIEYTASIKINP